jgi:hypothetical protein
MMKNPKTVFLMVVLMVSQSMGSKPFAGSEENAQDPALQVSAACAGHEIEVEDDPE